MQQCAGLRLGQKGADSEVPLCVCGALERGFCVICGMYFPCLCRKGRPVTVCCFLRFIVDRRKRMDSSSLLQSLYGLQPRRWTLEIHKIMLWVCNRSTGCTPAPWLSFCPCITTVFVNREKNGLSTCYSATHTSKNTANILWWDPWWWWALHWGNASYNSPGWSSGTTGASIHAKL